MQRLVVLVLLLLSSIAIADPFEDAENAYENRNFRHALELFHDAAKTDPDPERRARALARAANIEWRILHDIEAARRTLAGATAALPLLERARAEAELAHDYATAHAFAERAFAAAKKRDEKRIATVIDAWAAVTPVKSARLAGRCVSADALPPVASSIEQLINRDGPLISLDRVLLQCAILTNDRPQMLRAWRWYSGSLPADVPKDRKGLGEALADARFFDEAALVLDDPCAETRPQDAGSRQIVAYAAALRSIRDVTDEHYRQFSLGNNDVRQFRDAVEHLRQHDAEKRFRAVVRGGQTGGVDDMHYGHAVLDSEFAIEQYGHKAKVRFIAIDGMASIGYMHWMEDGGAGSGGWNAREGVYQIRPMYADGPVSDWLVVSDLEVGTTRDEETAKESKRDDTRDPLSAPRGTAMRMRRQSDNRALAELKAKGLTGDALRSAFIDRVRADVFASSILAHEGRHAIDNKTFMRGAEREYRAKLSEVAFAPDPRRAIIGGILVDIDASSPHGEANRRIFGNLTKWMRDHAPQIAGLDASRPLLPQLDKLTDEQMKEAFRSMDPLAK